MKSFTRKTTPFGAASGVDITPLLDVVFQLLLFFILTSLDASRNAGIKNLHLAYEEK
jgi:biopolymer transport protein ExbD